MDELNEPVSKMETYAHSQNDFNPSNIESLHSIYCGNLVVGIFFFVSKIGCQDKRQQHNDLPNIAAPKEAFSTVW